jgi:hypothetical protein
MTHLAEHGEVVGRGVASVPIDVMQLQLVGLSADTAAAVGKPHHLCAQMFIRLDPIWLPLRHWLSNSQAFDACGTKERCLRA